MTNSGTITFHYPYKAIPLKNKTYIKAFILHLFHQENKTIDQLNYIFCSDDYLLKINQDYLSHNTYTDIITFDLSNKNSSIISDIYISLDSVKTNAVTYKHPYYYELLRVMFHGALHLCGYKDKTGAEKKLMRHKEDFYLQQYHVSRETL